jgi:hypothetical protein
LLWNAVWDHQASKAPNAQGTGVLLESDSATSAHVAFVGKNHQVVEDLGSIRIDPNAANASEPGTGYAGGIGWDAGTADYAAFVYHPVNGEAAAWVWQLYLWDRRARKLTLVAHNPVDAAGRPLHSGYVQPKLTEKYLYWIQAAPDTTGWGGSQLMQYALATGQTKALYRGLTESFVPYRDQLLYTAIAPGGARPTPTDTNGPPERVVAVGQDTGAPATPPAGLTIAADRPNYVISDGDLVVWTTDQVVRAWRASWGKSVTLVPSGPSWPDGQRLQIAGPTYPALYGHFLVWNAGGVFVLDLRTGSFAQLAASGRVAGEETIDDMVSIEEYTTPAGNQVAARYQWNQYLFSLKGLPDLPACAH